MDPIVFGAIISAVGAILSAIAMLLGQEVRDRLTRRKKQKRIPIFLLGEPVPQFRLSAFRLYQRVKLANPKALNREPPTIAALTDVELSPDLTAQLKIIRMHLLAESSECKLQECLFEIKEFLSRHPAHPEGLLLRSQIIQAIQLSRKLRIFTYLQLLMFLFVLFVEIAGRLRRSRLTTTFDNPVMRKRIGARATQSDRVATWDGRFGQALASS